jgi:carboxymethylenebutenolidase
MTIGVQHLMLEVERVRDAFQQAVFQAADLQAAMATVAADCTLVQLPVGTGATGIDGLRRYLDEDLLPHLPADLSFCRVSRTVDRWRVVDETSIAFTHDRELPWLLPRVPATQRRAEVLAISVVSVRRSRITALRTLWDHATLLTQLRLDASDLPPTIRIRTSSAEPSARC